MLGPPEVLRAIASRLESAGEGPYKIRAFRRAAIAAEEAGPEQLEALWRAGRLTSLADVGDSSAAVIADVLATGSSTLLDSLQVPERAPLAADAAALRSAIRGDCHSHSEWSDGDSPIRVMAQAARALGRDYLVLSDHSPRLTIARGLSRERLLEQLEVVARVNEELAPFHLLSGIEVDILDDGSLDQDDDLLDRLDVVVASVHSKLRMESHLMTPRLVNAASNPRVDILGHATGRLVGGRGRPESTFEHREVFAACAASGTAVEVNARPDRQDPRRELLEIARAEGCVFAIDTDSHTPTQLEWMDGGCAQAADAGIDASIVVNTRSVDDLLSWTRTHG